MSLNRGCEERPSRRKGGGWEVGTEGAGAGAGPPGKRGQQHTRVFVHFLFIGNPECFTVTQEQAQVGHITFRLEANTDLYQVCFALKGQWRALNKSFLPLSERSPSRSSSSPPAEAGLVGIVVWITGTTSLPPSRSNKSLAWGTKTACNHSDTLTSMCTPRSIMTTQKFKRKEFIMNRLKFKYSNYFMLLKNMLTFLF